MDQTDQHVAIPLLSKDEPGQVALVSPEDAAAISSYRWVLHKTRTRRYAASSSRIGGKHVLMHRLILDAVHLTDPVDHVNGDGLDNRRGNLRLVSHQQNSFNQRPQAGKTSRFKGVHWDRTRDRWRASIVHGGRQIFLGRFHDEEEAAQAYDAKARELFGMHARLNFP